MAKPGAHQENYGLIYDDRAGPSESEAEHNIVYGPIPARMYAGHRMADGSYINYSKTKTIEHNVPVGFIGELKPKYLKKLQENQEHRYSKKDPGGGTRRGGESSKKGGESSKKSSKKDRDDHDDHHRRHRRRDHDGRA